MIGVFAAIIASILGGAINPTFIKIGTQDISPILFTALRFGLALLLFSPIYRHHHLKKLWGNKMVMFSSGVFAVNLLLFAYGVRLTSAIMSQVLFATTPLLVAVFELAFFGKRVHSKQLVGGIIAFVGLGILVLQSFTSADELSFGSPLGNFIILSATVFWSLYIVLSKQYAGRYSPISIVHNNYLITTSLALFLVAIEFLVIGIPTAIPSAESLGSLGLVALGGTATMFYMMQIAIKRLGAFTVSLFIYLNPLFAALTAIPLLGEQITPRLVMGASLIIFGVFYATAWDHLHRK